MKVISAGKRLMEEELEESQVVVMVVKKTNMDYAIDHAETVIMEVVLYAYKIVPEAIVIIHCHAIKTSLDGTLKRAMEEESELFPLVATTEWEIKLVSVIDIVMMVIMELDLSAG